ncbi:hypothetical protein SLEP1_g27678 [Rubroshorea leprosula]|uniref:Protein kinase domain-containing protein n=1 Tax=Rubroshorea leprosula TaxID=152421 RepID=A0AAV5JWR4_9ROSI|nr:hypothetical protein SLEP1_g27678 [Rubroshorea leprosula]
MKPNNFGGGPCQFLTEVQLLSQLHHQHLVSLIGFCYEGNERILVHEYMKHGTLRDYLQGRGFDPLPWKLLKLANISYVF